MSKKRSWLPGAIEGLGVVVKGGGAVGGVDAAGAEVEVLEARKFFGEGDVDVGLVLVEGGGVGRGGVEDEDAGHGSLPV